MSIFLGPKALITFSRSLDTTHSLVHTRLRTTHPIQAHPFSILTTCVLVQALIMGILVYYTQPLTGLFASSLFFFQSGFHRAHKVTFLNFCFNSLGFALSPDDVLSV